MAELLRDFCHDFWQIGERLKQNKKTRVSMRIICTLMLCLLTLAGCVQEDIPNSSQNHSNDHLDSSLETVEEAKEDLKPITWELVWQDEFEGDALDLTKWSYQIGNNYHGWGNYEAQYYTEENICVKDGMLIIEAKKEEIDGFQYSSGRIRTMTDEGEVLFGTQCGKIEARISMPVGEGLWPAFWMMPVDDAYGLWPLSGEIDIVEARGRVKDSISGAIHFGEPIPNNKKLSGDYCFLDSDISQFHVYAVEWNTNEIKWLVDDIVYFKTSNWYTMGNEGLVNEYPAPFDKPFYILLNLAVGGVYDDGILPQDEALPAQMKVDYVRAYKSRDGYEEISKEKKHSEMDVEAYHQVEMQNYIADEEFSTVVMQPLTSTPEYEKNRWYFLVKKHTNAEARGELVEIEGKNYFHCDIDVPGEYKYAIQLQHMVPFIKGYTYIIEFEAKAESERSISLQPIGIVNDEIVSYNGNIMFDLNEEMNHYYCSFMMKDDSDMEGILEFNLGLEEADITIGRVCVRILETN